MISAAAQSSPSFSAGKCMENRLFATAQAHRNARAIFSMCGPRIP